jgi:two-component system, OmpR family, sensor histidine kinase VicK
VVSTTHKKSPSALNKSDTSAPSNEEKTQVVYGEEKTIDHTVRFLNNAKERVECCLDSTLVRAAAVGAPQIVEALRYAKGRGVRLHYITEISKENISYCKVLAELVELRHLDKMKGKFAVNEFETISTAIVMRKTRSALKAIYSNIPEIVQQQQYFFETVWDKAIPAKQRIREIEEGVELTRTRLIEDTNEIFVESKKAIKEGAWFSACITVDAMKLMRNYYDKEIQTAAERIRKNSNIGPEDSKGFRWITAFEKEDMDTVQHFLNLGVEVRHVRNIIPMTFAVTDKKLIATVQEVKEQGLIHTALATNDPNYIRHYNALFDELWDKGFDALDRIRDIEEGRELGRVDVIDNPRQIHKIYLDIISSAKEEIIMMLPTGAFQREEEKTGLGILSLKEATRKGIKVRVLMPTEGREEEEIQDQIKDLTEHGLNIKAVHFPQQQIRINVVVVDRNRSLVVEFKDDTKAAFTTAAVGVAVCGTSRPTVLSYVTIFDSFWEQSELYERVREANEKLEQNDRLQREFINIAAHELRTPVQPILGMTELAELSLAPDRQEVKMTKEDLQIITRNAKRLQRLTSTILETARIEAGTLTLYKERFDLVELIKNTTRDIQKTHNDDKIIVDYYFRPSSDDTETNASLFVNADKSRITEVLWNLLDNAVKFTKAKGGGTISIVGEKIDNQAVIEIKDTGKGIEADMIPRLFSKFATTSHRGTGLGLFISKSIVEAHGGKISAENNKNGQGGTFTFALPIASQATYNR